MISNLNFLVQKESPPVNQIDNTTMINWLIAITVLLVFLLILQIISGGSFIVRWIFAKGSKLKLTKEKHGEDYHIEELLNAIDFFSQRKIGALIVFQRQVLLNPFLRDEGIKINADFSSDLLMSIFGYKETQLHDGAVIVDKKWKIVSASAFLPQHSKVKSIKKFGTRHSAAYAIVASTDAIACVVSERDGKIHFIANKKIEKIEKISTLRDKLKKELN